MALISILIGRQKTQNLLLMALVLQEDLEPQLNKSFNLAPCEGFTPLSIFQDRHAEELSDPNLFGGQARKTNHKVPLTYGYYCQIEMRHRDSRFRSHDESFCFKVKNCKHFRSHLEPVLQ